MLRCFFASLNSIHFRSRFAAMFQPEYPDANAEAWDGLALYQGATYTVPNGTPRDGGCESCGEVADADDVMKLIMRLIGDLDVGDQQRVMDNLAQLVGRSGTKIVGSGEMSGASNEMPGADYSLNEEANAFVGAAEGNDDEEVDFGIAPEALSDSAVMGSAEIVNFVIEEDEGEGAPMTGGAPKKESPSAPNAKPVSLDDFAFITEDEPMPNNDDDAGIGDVEDNPYNAAFGEWTENPEVLADVHALIGDLTGLI